MKVLFLTQRFEEDEAATEYIKQVATELVDSGHQAMVVAFDDGSYYSIDDRVEVHRVGLPFDGDNIYSWAMMMNNELKRKARELFEEKDPDVIHSIDWTALPGGVALSKHMEKPLVVTYQSTENERGFDGDHAGLISELEWQGAFEANKAIATSEDTKNSLLFDLDVPGEKIEIIDPLHESDWPERVLNSYKEVLDRKSVV